MFLYVYARQHSFKIRVRAGVRAPLEEAADASIRRLMEMLRALFRDRAGTLAKGFACPRPLFSFRQLKSDRQKRP